MNRKIQTYSLRTGCRTGVTLAELIAAAAVLTTVMSLATGMCYRVSTIWRDVGQHRVALVELSNQLDHLTTLPVKEIRGQLDSLAVSEACARTLSESELTANLAQTDLGWQVRLSLNWKRRNIGKPVELSGWVMEESEK